MPESILFFSLISSIVSIPRFKVIIILPILAYSRQKGNTKSWGFPAEYLFVSVKIDIPPSAWYIR